MSSFLVVATLNQMLVDAEKNWTVIYIQYQE